MANSMEELGQELRESNQVMGDVRENTNMTSTYLESVVDVFSTKLDELVSFMRGNQLDQLESRREEQGPPGADITPADDDNYIQDIMDKVKDLVDDALGIAGLTVGVIAAPFVIIGSFFSELKVQTQILNKFLRGGLGRFFSPITRFFEVIRNSKVITGLVNVWRGTVQPFFTRIGQFFGLLDDAGKAAGGFGKILRTATTIGKTLGRIFYPITVLIGLFNAVTGFMDGYDEGGVMEGIKQGAIKAFDAIVGSFVRLLGSAVSFIFDILGFDNFAAAITTQIDSVINGLYNSFGGIIDIIKGIFTLDLGMIKSGLTATFGGLVDIITAPINLAYSAIKDLFSFVGIELPEINFGGFIKDTISSAFDWIKNQLGFSEGRMPSIIDIVTGIVTAPYDLVRSVASWVAGKLGFDQVSDLLSSFSFSGLLKDIFNAPVNLLRSAKDWILNQLGFDGSGMPSVMDIVTGLYTAPYDLVTSVASWVAGKLGFDQISDLLGELSFADLLRSAVDTIWGLFTGAKDWIVEKITGFSISDTIGNIADAGRNFLKDILRSVLPDPSEGNAILKFAKRAIPDDLYKFAGLDPKTGEEIEVPEEDKIRVDSGSAPSRVAAGDELQMEAETQRDAERQRDQRGGTGTSQTNVNAPTNINSSNSTVVKPLPSPSRVPQNTTDLFYGAGAGVSP